MQEIEREGGDITADHMINQITEPSEIQQYFAGSTAFVTGGTGFLGRLLVEKLLRTCKDLKKIYLLVRPKKGKTPQQRFNDYFNDPLYDRLKRQCPEAMEKICMVSGDCLQPNLGIGERSEEMIVDEVNSVFHCAATVRFDETLKTAVNINVKGTRDILKLSRKIKDLKSIVYVSTAFSYCPRKEIDETFYEPTLTGNQLITLVDTLAEDTLVKITPTIIGDWPNTYAFTKSVAENVVQTEGADLPVAVVRPSIVVGTAKDPVAGWIDNFYGATGIFVGASLGLIRTLHCEPNNLADLVPADFVVNSVIAAAWSVGNEKSLHLNEEVADVESEKSKEAIPIYNYVSAPQNPITWRECTVLGNRHLKTVPSSLVVWHYMFYPTPNRYLYLLLHFLLHMLPAYIVDCLALCIGRKPQLVKGYKKIKKFLEVIAYFSSQQWIFRNNNTKKLWNKLNAEDRKLYEFDMANLDWDLYFHTFTRGGRVYLLKESLDTIPQATSKRLKLKVAHYVLVSFLILGFLNLLRGLINVVY